MRYLVSAAVLAAINLAMWAALLAPSSFGLQGDPRTLAWFGILVSGLMLACLFAAPIGTEIPASSLRQEAVALIAVSAALLAFGVVAGKVSPVPAALVLICGSAALLIGLSAVEDLRDKKGLEITSHWGGFGGSTGGWRVSPAVTTIILALVFLGAAVGVAGLSGVDGTEGNNIATPNAPAKDVASNDVANNSMGNDAKDANASANNLTADANATGENVAAPAGIGDAPSRTPVDSPE